MPTGISLEDPALSAAKTLKHNLVVAGPGAGKTELLAQRACFLLQTGSCPPPYRILAISFKREAAENLRARVLLRCGRELASRFDSMTFDAFGKDLVDRFRLALPLELRPSPDYEILTGADVNDERMRQRMLHIATEHCPLSRRNRESVTGEDLRAGMFSLTLPFSGWPELSHYTAGAGMWRALLAEEPSKLTFAMINRLAEFLVRTDTAVRSALRDTYRFVFLDEFQDTTNAQVELTETCFHGSAAILTAVGDTKQRIMGWAGAQSGVFGHFKNRFGAELVKLTQNHRSRSRLVEIQSVFAAELDPDSAPAVTARTGSETGECRVWEFPGEAREAQYLTEVIAALVEAGTPPEEICVLCRARPDQFAAALVSKLKEAGVKVKVEVNRRETIGEPVSALLLDMLELVFSKASPDAWDHVGAVASEIAGDGDDHSAFIRTRTRLLVFLNDQPPLIVAAGETEDAIKVTLDRFLAFIGRERFAALHPQYAQGKFLDDVVTRLAKVIADEVPDTGWAGVVDAVKGVGAISVMTMHKSKGLEFDTVIFLGLEDDALWNFQRNNEEETCGLFVALSRAKQRCYFTFCRQRSNRHGFLQAQSRITVKRIYELFEAAGVALEKIENHHKLSSTPPPSSPALTR